MFLGFRFCKTYVDDNARQAATPTPAQAKAGNYRLGHTTVGGLNVAIETPKGGTRSGVDPHGNAWSVVMPAHYGYVNGTQGGRTAIMSMSRSARRRMRPSCTPCM